jgi:hypothetical protein
VEKASFQFAGAESGPVIRAVTVGVDGTPVSAATSTIAAITRTVADATNARRDSRRLN